MSQDADDDGLVRLQRAIAADAILSDVTVTRAPRRVYWLSRDEPADTLVLQTPVTSTEFMIRWGPEPEHRIHILPGGRARDTALRNQGDTEKWTPEYRAYHDDFMNGRAFGFRTRGTFDPDVSRPFFSVWAVEKANLHPPGHDDSGEIRTDRHSALSMPIFAGSPVKEVLDWLHQTLGDQARIMTPTVPAAVATENAVLARWPGRIREAQSAARDQKWLQLQDHSPVVQKVLDAVDAERLFLMFPRDRKGGLAPRVRALLAPAGAGSDLERAPWVVAAGPPRTGSHIVTLRVERVIAINEVHRFDLVPAVWRRGSGSLTEPATWGTSSDDRGAITLLRQGKVDAGLRMAGLHLDEAMLRMASGHVLGVICDEPDWSEEARERLSLVLPGLLMTAGLAYARHVLHRPSKDSLRLFTLSGQRHARKASVVIVPSNPPTLKLEWTGSNRRLTPLLWQRPPIPGAWPIGQ